MYLGRFLRAPCNETELRLNTLQKWVIWNKSWDHQTPPASPFSILWPVRVGTFLLVAASEQRDVKVYKCCCFICRFEGVWKNYFIRSYLSIVIFITPTTMFIIVTNIKLFLSQIG